MSRRAGRQAEFSDFLSDAEAIEQRPLPFAARSTLYVLVALILLALLWASLSEVDRIVITRGKLITTTPNLVIQPLEPSIIRTIDVQVGQIVRKGQQLATFDPTFTTSDVSQVRARLRSLDAQARRIEAELAGAKNFQADSSDPEERLQMAIFQERRANFDSKVRSLDETINRLQASITGNQEDQKVLRERRAKTLEMEQMQESLGRGNFLPKLQVLEIQNQRLQTDRELQQATNLAQELRRDLARAQAERSVFVKDWRQRLMEELVTTKRSRDPLVDQAAKADRKNELQIMNAPSDAVVLEVAKRSVGSVLKEAEPLITLVPLDAPLEAEVQIDAKDISYVRAGDPARIKLDAFPFQKHGVARGRTRTISEDAFARERLESSASRAGPDAFYLGRVSLEAVALKQVPKDMKLIPGMTLTAEIVFGKRTVISYFLYPIIRSLDESLREP